MASRPLKIGIVAEGPTDLIMLESAIKTIMKQYCANQEYTLDSLQPEVDANMNQLSGSGWPNVYKWCRECVEMANGPIRNHILLANYSALIIQLDADVADKTFLSAHITAPINPNSLPCTQRCPPPCATTDALRNVLLAWINEVSVPPNVVLCTPSKALESWIIIALPDKTAAMERIITQIECHRHPDKLLSSMPAGNRLISSGHKRTDRYKSRSDDFADNWTQVVQHATEAQRFQSDFIAKIC